MKYLTVFLYLFTFLLTAFGLILFVQHTHFSFVKMHYVIEKVSPGSAAEKVGMKSGDKITGIDSQPISSMLDLVMKTEKNIGKEITFSITRDTETLSKQVVVPTEYDAGQGRLGILFQVRGFSRLGLLYFVKETFIGIGFLLVGLLILANRNRSAFFIALVLLGIVLVLSMIVQYLPGILYYGAILIVTLIWWFRDQRTALRSSR